MALVDWPRMEFARAEAHGPTSLASLAHSFGLQSPFLSELSMQAGTPISPVSALGPGLNSPGLLSGLDAPYTPTASTSAGLGQAELGERLQQLLALQQAHQTCGQQKPGTEAFSQAQMLPVFNSASLCADNEANELLALQAALSQQQARNNASQNASGTVGPSNNPLYKTELCRSWEEFGSCRYGIKCQFAHGREELRPVHRHPKYKTEICRTFATTGTCPYGTRCRFIHQSAALAQLRIATGTTPRAAVTPSSGSPFGISSGDFSLSPSSHSDGLMLPALHNILQQAQHMQHSSSYGNLRSMSPGNNTNNTNGGTASPPPSHTSSLGSLFALGAFSNGNGNGNHTANGYSGIASSPVPHGAIGEALSVPQTPVATPPGLFISTENHINAPSTPHSPGMSLFGGGVRRSISDNALMTPQGAGTVGGVATPTSARRLPIFSSLSEAETASK